MPTRTLIEGVVRYETELRPRYHGRFKDLADGQKPKTMFIGCADSRVESSVIMGTDPGELFVVRNVGNLVPPMVYGIPLGGATSVVSAVTCAVEVLNIESLVVCGHSACGGIKAALHGHTLDQYVTQWLKAAEPAVKAYKEQGAMTPGLSDVDAVAQWSALHQLDHLRTYETVRRAEAEGRLSLHAMFFDIPHGMLLSHDAAAGRFHLASEVLANRQDPSEHLAHTA